MSGPTELKVGTPYLGVLCRRCGEHIPTAADDSLAAKTIDMPRSTKGEPIGAFCPFCGFLARYNSDELKSRTLNKLPGSLP